MTDRASLLEAIHQEPDSDALRLVYADWLDDHDEPERAEFIRVQVESQYYLKGSPEHTRLTDRAVALLTKHRGLWASGYENAIPTDAVLSVHKNSHEDGILLLIGRPVEYHCGWTLCFRRGFVDEIQYTPKRLFSLGPFDIHPTGPCPTLRLLVHNLDDNSSLGTFADVVRELASAPLLYRFRDVRIDGGFSSTTAEGLRFLASEPTFVAKLGGLLLSEDPIGDPDLLPILKSPDLTRLRELAIDHTDCTWAVLKAIIDSDRFRGMTDLKLSGVIKGAQGLRVFAVPGRWPRLRWLSLGECGLDDLTLRGLMRSGAFPALEGLDLCFNDVHFQTLRALVLSGAFPRLRILGVGGTPLTLDDVNLLRSEFGHRVEIWFPVPRPRGPAKAEPTTDFPVPPT